MSLKSSIGHTLNGISEIVSSGWAGKYMINSGVDHGLSATHYNERLVEIPFVFRHIKPAPADVLDIGCVESVVPIQLSMMGYDVIGIDIRDHGYRHPNFRFLKDDFLQHKFTQKFDVAIDISAIEHFGLDTYGYDREDGHADKQAVDKVHALLKPGGQFIFTAPFGIRGVVENFERIYDAHDLGSMLKGFKVNDMEFYSVSGHKTLKRIKQSEASRIKYSNNLYAVVLINAFKV